VLPADPPRGLTRAEIYAYDRHLEALTEAFTDRTDAAQIALDAERAPLAGAALRLEAAEHRALALAILSADAVTTSDGPDRAWAAWGLKDRRDRLAYTVSTDLDAIDALLEPFLAPGRPPPDPAVRADALALQERALAFA